MGFVHRLLIVVGLACVAGPAWADVTACTVASKQLLGDGRLLVIAKCTGTAGESSAKEFIVTSAEDLRQQAAAYQPQVTNGKKAFDAITEGMVIGAPGAIVTPPVTPLQVFAGLALRWERVDRVLLKTGLKTLDDKEIADLRAAVLAAYDAAFVSGGGF